MDTSPLSKHTARPGQSMEEHLQGVEKRSRSLISGAGTTPYGDDWEELASAIAWVHDIGKLSEYFQTYIETGDRTAAGDAQLTYHGKFGGLVASVALMERGLSAEATAAGFYAVAKHHSVLGNFHDQIGSYHVRNKTRVDDTYELATQQLKSIDQTAAEAADVVIRNASDGAYSWDRFVDDGTGRPREVLRTLAEVIDDEEWYGCALRAWSTLVAADKMDASGLDAVESTPSERPATDRLTHRVRSLSTTTLPNGTPVAEYLDHPERTLPDETASLEQRLGAIRTAANARVTERLQDGHERGKQTFELTLPTGFGKTYTGLRAALDLADVRDSRVIYALPYTSIIDQVDEQVRDVFGLSPQDPAYTKHHHLADTRSALGRGSDAGESYSTGQETLHAESWRSGLVLTTFTQLFESAAGPENVQSTKLPALQDAVVLVDEPQAISMDWWGLIGRLVTHLTEEYDATIVFMTATQPRLLNRLPYAPTPEPLTDLGTDAIDLIADSPRVEFRLHESLTGHFDSDRSPFSLDDAATEIDDATTGETNSLAVVNTVDSAAELSATLLEDGAVALGSELLSYWREHDAEAFDPVEYLDRVAERHPDAETVVSVLTTRLRPRDRTALIGAIDAILDEDVETPFDSVPTVTVSTQLIEAGVDLSFDRLYRDYAPLPAIVQAAGRCNRRFGGEPAPVTVWRLDGPEDANYVPSRLIYGDRSLLRPTRTALSDLLDEVDGDELPESLVIDRGVRGYYDALHEQRQTESRSDDLVAAFDEARGEVLRNASLVSSDYPTRDYLVLVDDDESETYSRYRQQRDAGHWSRARASFQALKQTLVSVPVSEEPENDTPTPITVSERDERYDIETGQGVIEETVQTDSEV